MCMKVGDITIAWFGCAVIPSMGKLTILCWPIDPTSTALSNTFTPSPASHHFKIRIVFVLQKCVFGLEQIKKIYRTLIFLEDTVAI